MSRPKFKSSTLVDNITLEFSKHALQRIRERYNKDILKEIQVLDRIMIFKHKKGTYIPLIGLGIMLVVSPIEGNEDIQTKFTVLTVTYNLTTKKYKRLFNSAEVIEIPTKSISIC